MTIGLPKALLYYRYQYLWQTFFDELECEVVTSQDTCQKILTEGIARSISECCLPVKLFMGHVASLRGRCDNILIPRFETLEKNEEFCVRFWGLPDIVHNIFPNVSLISYDLQGHRHGNEWHGFHRMGKYLGKSSARIKRAYRDAVNEQRRQDQLSAARQGKLFESGAPKILLVSQPYVIHDAFVGQTLVRMLREQGGVPIYADRCDRRQCRSCAKSISADLYWTLNKEIAGAIPLLKSSVDGVLLVSAFPCGCDSLVDELILRRVKDIPMAQIIVDEQQGEAGMQTRIESFMDIVCERKRANER